MPSKAPQARSQLCRVPRGPLGLALLPGMAAVLLCLCFHLPAAAWHVPARSAPHVAPRPYVSTPRLAPAAPRRCSRDRHCQPVCTLPSPLPQPCCQGQPRGCQSRDPHAPRAPSSFCHSNPACLCWVSLPWPSSCSAFILLPVSSSFPSLRPAASVLRHVEPRWFAAHASSPFARLFVSFSLPPAYSTSNTIGLFFFFPLSCSFWLPRPLISFGVWEERREEEEGGGEAAFPRAFVRAKWSGRATALPRRRAARRRGRSRGIAVSGATQFCSPRAGGSWDLLGSWLRRLGGGEILFSSFSSLLQPSRPGGGRERLSQGKATGREPALAVGLHSRCADVGRAGGSPGSRVVPGTGVVRHSRGCCSPRQLCPRESARHGAEPLAAGMLPRAGPQRSPALPELPPHHTPPRCNNPTPRTARSSPAALQLTPQQSPASTPTYTHSRACRQCGSSHPKQPPTARTELLPPAHAAAPAPAPWPRHPHELSRGGACQWAAGQCGGTASDGDAVAGAATSEALLWGAAKKEKGKERRNSPPPTPCTHSLPSTASPFPSPLH